MTRTVCDSLCSSFSWRPGTEAHKCDGVFVVALPNVWCNNGRRRRCHCLCVVRLCGQQLSGLECRPTTDDEPTVASAAAAAAASLPTVAITAAVAVADVATTEIRTLTNTQQTTVNVVSSTVMTNNDDDENVDDGGGYGWTFVELQTSYTAIMLASLHQRFLVCFRFCVYSCSMWVVFFGLFLTETTPRIVHFR